MALALTNVPPTPPPPPPPPSSSSSSQFVSGIEDSSGNPNNGRALGRSISLGIVLSYVYWLFITAIFRHSRSQGEMGAEGDGDVESGGGEELRLQAAAQPNVNLFVVSPPPIVVGGGGSSQVTETTIRGNQAFVFEAEPGRGGLAASYISEDEHVILSNPQFIGQQVVGIWIVPTLVGVISGLIQVAVGSQRVNSDQKLMFYFCLGVSLETAILGIVLFILSTMNWSNPRRDLIIRSIVVVALGSTFVDMCVLITFGFIVVQSKKND